MILLALLAGIALGVLVANLARASSKAFPMARDERDYWSTYIERLEARLDAREIDRAVAETNEMERRVS